MRSLLLATTVAAAALLPTGTASADDVVVHRPDTTGVHTYWTPERIEAMPTGDVTPGAPPVDGPDGAPVRQSTLVDRTVGRLFFVDRGEDSSCTATLVVSANRATAVTAGHCVHGFDLIGNNPQWTTKLLFVPGFRDGTMPYGAYAIRAVVTPAAWVADDQRSEYDQAFLVLERPVNAAQPLAFDLPGNLKATELGYPRAARIPGHQGRPEFTGQRVARCWGTPAENPGTPDWPEPRGQWGVPCDMGGGSSGGPRLTGFNDRTGVGVVVGVNTQSAYLDDVRHLVGPQFTRTVTAPLYHRAQSM